MINVYAPGLYNKPMRCAHAGFFLHILKDASPTYFELLAAIPGWHTSATGDDLNDRDRCFLSIFADVQVTLTQYMNTYRHILKICGTYGHVIDVTGTYNLVSEAFDNCTEGRVETNFEKHWK